MNKKETLQTVTILLVAFILVVASSWFSKKERIVQLPPEVIKQIAERPTVECSDDFASYEKVKSQKNVVVLQNAISYGREDGSFEKHTVSLIRKGLKSQIACGYLFYRISVGNRPIQQQYENLYMRPVNSQFGGHILPNVNDDIRNEDINKKTEILIPLETISYDGTTRNNIRKANWASLLNVSDQMNFEIALNTTSKSGQIDSVEIAYKCWNPKTGEETDDCNLEVTK